MKALAQITISLLEDGSTVTVSGQLPQEIAALGMLEKAKALLPTLYADVKNGKGRLVLPNGPLPPNGRG